ncbi:MAG TPA: hypothetical protein VK186_04495 [Candidatus Deferrimicrobium sp.]|nr:hypothetical protein [Candidatus Deferrimicrobium sp.]
MKYEGSTVLITHVGAALWGRPYCEKIGSGGKRHILYFDPTLAVYYPQGKSYRW